jgi:hypothetical protein
VPLLGAQELELGKDGSNLYSRSRASNIVLCKHLAFSNIQRRALVFISKV